MGACASCLGLKRHPSQDAQDDDLDRILDSEQPSYGTTDSPNDLAQPDEAELRREREELERVTAEAADHMIDISQPSDPHWDNTADEDETEENGPEGIAWLKSIQSAGLGVEGPTRGSLVMDIGLLRQDVANKAS